MKKAAIDIGTNSVRLLLCDFESDTLSNREKKLIMTRLGKGQHDQRRLQEGPVSETLKALALFKEECQIKGYHLEGIIATSAVRDALNPEDLLGPAKDNLQMEIEVISGQLEAELGYIGAVKGFAFQDHENQLIIDIGGGSTELILGQGDRLIASTSVDMGAVRMTEGFYCVCPPHDLDIERMRHKIRELLGPYSAKLGNADKLNGIGIGGTATTLAAIALELEVYDADRVHGYHLSIAGVREIIEALKGMTLEEKKHLKGLDPKRADIILSGALILEETLMTLGITTLIVSDFDNLEGLLLRHGGRF